jgi:hypothetical protein
VIQDGLELTLTINEAPSELHDAFERAVPMSRDDQERQRSQVDAALKSLD